MTFVAALREACLVSAKALGADITKLSWFLRNQDRKEHEQAPEKKAA